MIRRSMRTFTASPASSNPETAAIDPRAGAPEAGRSRRSWRRSGAIRMRRPGGAAFRAAPDDRVNSAQSVRVF